MKSPQKPLWLQRNNHKLRFRSSKRLANCFSGRLSAKHASRGRLCAHDRDPSAAKICSRRRCRSAIANGSRSINGCLDMDTVTLPIRSFRVDPPRVELGSPPRQGGVFPLDHEPVFSVDRMGIEPITPILQGSVASLGTCQPECLWLLLSPCARATPCGPCSVEGPSGNRTRSPSLPRRCAAGTPTDPFGCLRHHSRGYGRRGVESRKDATSAGTVIPDGLEPSSSWLSTRRRRRWTTGSCQ